MKKEIHIFGGGTFSDVRAHFSLAARSFGTTAKRLKELCKSHPDNNLEVCLHLTKMADSNSNLVTNQDVANLVNELLIKPAVKIIIFNIALVDFEPAFLSYEDVKSNVHFSTEFGKYEKRLKTREMQKINLEVKPSEKIISSIRTKRKDIFLIGFKTTSNASLDEQYTAGLKLLRDSSCSLVLANDVVTRENLIITPEGSVTFQSKDRAEVLVELVDFIFKRHNGRYPRSVMEDNKFELSDDIFNLFYNIGKKLFDKGLFPTIGAGTFGNMSLKVLDEFIITGRSVDKGNLKPEQLIKVSSVDLVKEETVWAEVKYKGSVKPSIDSAIHAMIYQKTSCKAIIHIHTEKIFANIPITEFNYPCGTETEATTILKLISEKEPEGLIQMLKHGILVWSSSLEKCLAKIESLMKESISIKNFDISQPGNDVLFQEWLKHADEVYHGSLIEFKDATKFKLLLTGNNPVGLIYQTYSSKEVIDNVIYTFEKYQKKGLGLGSAALSIIETLARLSGIKTIRILTTDGCKVEDYYIKKFGFKRVSFQDFIIVLERNII